MAFDFNLYSDEEYIAEDTQSKQALCLQCGKCCRSATTFYPYHKLLEMAKKDEKKAAEFLEVFEPYPSINEARKIVPDQVEQVINIIKTRDDIKIEDLTFYHCRYIDDQNLCTIYERRPSCCIDAPYHGWSLMPLGCGYEGWQFFEREKQKSIVRKLKESLYIMEALSEDGITMPIRNVPLDELRMIIDEKIKPWRRYGSDLW